MLTKNLEPGKLYVMYGERSGNPRPWGLLECLEPYLWNLDSWMCRRYLRLSDQELNVFGTGKVPILYLGKCVLPFRPYSSPYATEEFKFCLFGHFFGLPSKLEKVPLRLFVE